MLSPPFRRKQHSIPYRNCVVHRSQKLLRSPRKPTRKISKIPFKVLDAPELQDDFYLNLVDWSSLNVLSVGLGTCVYLWSACTSQVCVICSLSALSKAARQRGNQQRALLQFKRKDLRLYKYLYLSNNGSNHIGAVTVDLFFFPLHLFR